MMKRIPKSFIRDYFLTAAAFILLGVVFLALPDTSSKIICYIFGGFLCLLGLIRVIDYFRTPLSISEYRLSFVVGIVAVGAGVYVFVKPELLAGILPTAFGIAILLDSLIKLQNTFDMLRCHDKKWRLTLIMVLVTAALGIVLLVNPFKAAETLLMCVGISLVANGLMDAVALLAIYNLMKEGQKTAVSCLDEDELD